MKTRPRRMSAMLAAVLCCLAVSAAAPALYAQTQTELPAAFRELSLGMSLDSLKEHLLADGEFNFRGDRDVSFLPVTEQNLVETEGSHFIKRAFFQLKDGAVFIMAFTMNTALIDHYSVYSAFVKKYGEPQRMNPKEAVWENDTARVSIERPLTVKYIDKQVFDRLLEDSRVTQSRNSALREEFLNEF